MLLGSGPISMDSRVTLGLCPRILRMESTVLKRSLSNFCIRLEEKRKVEVLVAHTNMWHLKIDSNIRPKSEDFTVQQRSHVTG